MKNLLNKKILFIICGGISAYKSLETIRLFKKNGAEIKTILTTSAKEFVTPLSITSLSQGKVYSDLFSVENEAEMDHISLSRWADIIVIAPATAKAPRFLPGKKLYVAISPKVPVFSPLIFAP